MVLFYAQPIGRYIRSIAASYYALAWCIGKLCWLSFLDLVDPLEENKLDPWNRTGERDAE